MTCKDIGVTPVAVPGTPAGLPKGFLNPMP